MCQVSTTDDCSASRVDGRVRRADAVIVDIESPRLVDIDALVQADPVFEAIVVQQCLATVVAHLDTVTPDLTDPIRSGRPFQVDHPVDPPVFCDAAERLP